MLIERMIRAARLEVGLYEEVEADLSATQQALQVVIIVAIASAIGGALLVILTWSQISAAAAALGTNQGSMGAAVIGGIINGILRSLIFWVVWAYVIYYVGTQFFGGTATPGEMLRTIGFAQTPGVLYILIFIPVLGGLIALVAFVWTVVAVVIAIRQGLDFTTGKAILTAIISAVIVIVASAILQAILNVIGLGTAMV